MKAIKQFCCRLIGIKWVELFIVAVILVNCVLIGVETYGHHSGIALIQTIILGIFTFEIAVRFIARDSWDRLKKPQKNLLLFSECLLFSFVRKF